jgi:hypothetical protein
MTYFTLLQIFSLALCFQTLVSHVLVSRYATMLHTYENAGKWLIYNISQSFLGWMLDRMVTVWNPNINRHFVKCSLLISLFSSSISKQELELRNFSKYAISYNNTIICSCESITMEQSLLEKKTLAVLIKTLPAIRKVSRPITITKRICHCTLSWAKWMQSTFSHRNYSRPILLLSSHRLITPKLSLSLKFSD